MTSWALLRETSFSEGLLPLRLLFLPIWKLTSLCSVLQCEPWTHKDFFHTPSSPQDTSQGDFLVPVPTSTLLGGLVLHGSSPSYQDWCSIFQCWKACTIGPLSTCQVYFLHYKLSLMISQEDLEVSPVGDWLMTTRYNGVLCSSWRGKENEYVSSKALGGLRGMCAQLRQ